MLVYANHLSFQGSGAGTAIFKGIGGWLKEQLGFGLHPDQLKQDGEFNGTRGSMHSRLRILSTTEDDPELYSWVLKHQDDHVHGRQWIVEVGLKRSLERAWVLSSFGQEIRPSLRSRGTTRIRVDTAVLHELLRLNKATCDRRPIQE